MSDDPKTETGDDEEAVAEMMETISDLSEAARDRLTGKCAAEIEEIQALGLRWQLDGGLAPYGRHMGASLGRVAADLSVGFAVARMAYSELVANRNPTAFLDTILRAYPDRRPSDDLVRELLAEATLTIHCLEVLAASVPIEANRTPALLKMVDVLGRTLEWVWSCGSPVPSTH